MRIFWQYVCMYVKIRRHHSTRACTRTQARGATPELRRVTDTQYSTHTGYRCHYIAVVRGDSTRGEEPRSVDLVMHIM